ncbi:hypothetical protein LXL04_009155 [Taraxacum kok-saghyz]
MSILSIVNDLCFYSASNVHFKIRGPKTYLGSETIRQNIRRYFVHDYWIGSSSFRRGSKSLKWKRGFAVCCCSQNEIRNRKSPRCGGDNHEIRRAPSAEWATYRETTAINYETAIPRRLIDFAEVVLCGIGASLRNLGLCKECIRFWSI